MHIYILTCNGKLTLKNIFTKPWVLIIKLFTWSKIQHVADYYDYADCGKLINQAVGTGYESINYKKFFKKRKGSTIRAYKIKVPIDFNKWDEDTKSAKGIKYDVKGSVGSAVDKIPVLRTIFRKDPNDTELFCSEAIVEKLQNQGLLPIKINKNFVNPKELIKLLKKYDLVEDTFITLEDNKLLKDFFK